eukprot:gene4776-6698_t
MTQNDNEQQNTTKFYDTNLYPKLDFNEDYYNVLEVDPNINAKELKKAYYKIVFKYHPDNKETIEEKKLCNMQMMVINGAYRVLRESENRKKYDLQRKKGLFGAKAGVKGSGKNDNDKESSNKQSVQQKQDQSDRFNVEDDIDQQVDKNNYVNDDKKTSQQSRESFNKKSVFNSQSPTASRFRAKYFMNDDNIEESSFENENNDERQVNEQRNKRKNEVNKNNNDEIFNNFNDNYDFEFAEILKKRYENSKRTSSQTTEASKKVTRGDGSLTQLKIYLNSLIREKEQKEKLLLLDNRDWGEVTNSDEIRQRLKDIQALRELEQKISDLEDEIEGLLYPYSYERQPYNDRSWNYDNNDNNQNNSPYQPQPQTQEERERRGGGGFWDWGSRGKEVEERDNYRRKNGNNNGRSTGRSSPPRSLLNKFENNEEKNVDNNKFYDDINHKIQSYSHSQLFDHNALLQWKHLKQQFNEEFDFK